MQSRGSPALTTVVRDAALGMPVVSTNVGGIPYIFEHEKNALLVNDNNAEALASQVIRIIRDENLRNSLIQNSLKLVREYDWPNVSRKWREILT